MYVLLLMALALLMLLERTHNMHCPKCDTQLTSEQKVCVKCGAYTPASGYFYQDSKEFQLTKTSKLLILILGFFLVFLLLYKLIHITPPHAVAEQWLKAMTSRQINHAAKLVTEDFKSALIDNFSDMREVSDNLYVDASLPGASLVVKKANMDHSLAGNRANVAALILHNGKTIKQMEIELVLQGRKWKINNFR